MDYINVNKFCSNFKLRTACIYVIWVFLVALIPSCHGLTITTHSKPQETSNTEPSTELETSTIVAEDNPIQNDSSLVSADRQKRLLPYVNFYTTSNKKHYVSPDNQKPKNYHLYLPKVLNDNPQEPNNEHLIQDKNLRTPFLETNALPGPFVPIIRNPQKNIKIHYVTLQQQKPHELPPDFSDIYGKLWEVKSIQQQRPPQYVENYEYSPNNKVVKPQQDSIRYKPPAIKTVIRTYLPKNIDVAPTSGREEYKNNYQQENVSLLKHVPVRIRNNIQPYVTKQMLIDLPLSKYIQRPKHKTPTYRKPIIVLQRPPIYYPEDHIQKPVQKPIVYIRPNPTHNLNHYSSPIVEENYVAQKYVNDPHYQKTQTLSPVEPPVYIPSYYKYESIYDIQPVTPLAAPSPEPIHIEPQQLQNTNSNSLSLILKKLQEANALPQTLTVDNIDNSIRTLVKILNTLKKQQKFSKPIVVAETNEDYSGETGSREELPIKQTPEIPELVVPEPHVPETVVPNYPEDTQEGGTPGTPGVDYPALSSIPPTSFNCKTQRYKGFFGDPDTNCQVWHYCDLNGGQASFLCPNGTIFSQVALTCDWWYNVKCSSTAQLYVLNERLYKYILPFAPKFPEDYTGPLVDKYLALKFMEMEEKMKKERKGKGDSYEEEPPLDEGTESKTEENTANPI